jgi:hypothetical protein
MGVSNLHTSEIRPNRVRFVVGVCQKTTAVESLRRERDGGIELKGAQKR